MTVAWSATRSTHAVQFYEDERFLHQAIVAFLVEAGESDPLVMIARRRTFEAVTHRLAGLALAEMAGRITFIDADEGVGEFIEGPGLDPLVVERRFSALFDEVRRAGAGTVRFYGEMVDVLCTRGAHRSALQLEELWNRMSDGFDVTCLCGYAIANFDRDTGADQLRAVCRQHTHVRPAEGVTGAPDDRARLEEIAVLQHRARALDRRLAHESEPAPGAAAIVIPGATVYVVDDDASVRSSLARLLASVRIRTQTFASAEAFLADVDATSTGCLVVDVQLLGMSGPDLQSRMGDAHWQMPVIAMSGSHDLTIEKDALRLGATAFLRKPFDAQVFLDAIARALSVGEVE